LANLVIMATKQAEGETKSTKVTWDDFPEGFAGLF
jgi:hypothetical protein